MLKNTNGAPLNVKPVKRCSLILRILFAIIVIALYPFIAVAVIGGYWVLVGIVISIFGR